MAASITPIVLGSGEGRAYDMGALRAVFKADGPEVQGRFSVSEWWLDARHEGPGAHKHDEVFYVLKGEASILVGQEWRRLAQGSVCVIPRGVMHDFRNDGARPMRLLNLFLPGPFEAMMPMIVDWHRERPARRLA